ncbi:MAG: DUF2332 domain-containing protein [Acidimicrobiales bacterium]|nr:DUF2332 domain-containing protein [Acidimicrobiales bacterium]
MKASIARFAGAVARLPLYRRIAEAASLDDEVASLLLLADTDDRNPTLLFAAVHDYLLAESDWAASPGTSLTAHGQDPLADWYPSLRGQPTQVSDGSGDPWPHFRRVALDEPKVAETMATRGTQTNEVGRCATTVPALGFVQRDVNRPIGLVEVGASAGLNLRLDSYGYRWTREVRGSESGPSANASGRDGHDSVELLPGRPVMVESRWRAGRRPAVPTEMVAIGARMGIDRDPVDLSDTSAARWLIACQWPEQVERLERCRAAVREARSAAAAGETAPVRRGDLVDLVGPAVVALPDDSHPVVLATWVLTYLGPEGQRRFLAALDGVAASRDLTLVLQEEPSAAPGLDLPPRPDVRSVPGPTALCRIDWRDGRRGDAVRLADQHPHGTWAEWFA